MTRSTRNAAKRGRGRAVKAWQRAWGYELYIRGRRLICPRSIHNSKEAVICNCLGSGRPGGVVEVLIRRRRALRPLRSPAGKEGEDEMLMRGLQS